MCTLQLLRRLFCLLTKLYLYNQSQPHDAQVADGAPIEAVLTLGFYDAAECTVSGLTLADYTSSFDACSTQPSMTVISDLLRELVSESDS
jgi:hypothetical protein